MAGPWLRFRGHLDNISNNCFIGAINAFNGEAEQGEEPAHRRVRRSAAVQRAYKAAGIGTIVVGDENYGEGSSREHAAMEPRHLGVRAILVKSSRASTRPTSRSRACWRSPSPTPPTTTRFQEDDTIDIVGLQDFAPGIPLTIVLRHKDGSVEEFSANHTYNMGQIEWFKAGGALNLIKQQIKG
jgi:aconitate hydratase